MEEKKAQRKAEADHQDILKKINQMKKIEENKSPKNQIVHQNPLLEEKKSAREVVAPQ